MARNFIIFFEGKEGTSPLVRLLNTFDSVAVIHQKEGKWEPFDKHACGSIALNTLKQCLDSIYGEGPLEIEALNQLYTQTATTEIEPFSKEGAVGLKMRFRSKADIPKVISSFPVGRKSLVKTYKNRQREQFKQLMFQVLKQHNIVVFMAIRQDMLRWALSRYHGDGSGKQGHLQFKLAQGLLTKNDIPKIHVDTARFSQEIAKCQAMIAQKDRLSKELKALGIPVFPLIYEDFCANKQLFFEHLFTCLNLSISSEEVETRLAQGSQFRKVHSTDIAEFVENHQEVLDKFGQFQTIKSR